MFRQLVSHKPKETLKRAENVIKHCEHDSVFVLNVECKQLDYDCAHILSRGQVLIIFKC